MLIDLKDFTPWLSLFGGILIGIAVSILLLFNGKIAGISGIIAGLMRPSPRDTSWRVMFLLGLIAAPIVYQVIVAPPTIIIEAGWSIIILAGILVGIGTRFSGGCTSGHGVCGLARLSQRSFVATTIFVLAGILTVFISKHVFGG